MAKKREKTDIIDYISWRGDLSFSASPLNVVDALIFCQLSYLNFTDLAPADFSSTIPLSDLARRFLTAPDFETRSDLGALIDKQTIDLLEIAGNSVRFGQTLVTGFVSEYDQEQEKQFSATTFVIDKETAFVAFRGTDDTLIGWKEDFNLAFMDEVPAQKAAAAYLTAAATAYKKCRLFVGGHSKGGNLAIFSAAHLAEKMQKRLQTVYNFDGPGFSSATLASPAFLAIKPKTFSVFPQLSTIGMLFRHYEHYEIVQSDEKLLMQHNPFSWFVHARDFARLNEFDSGSDIFFKSFNNWFEGLQTAQREQFVETLFGVLDSTHAKTNSELSHDPVKNAGKVLKAFVELDSDIRDEAIKIAGEFLKITGNEIKAKLID